MEEKLIDRLEKNGEYYFIKNADGQLVSNNNGVGNKTAHSYLKLDLSNFEGEHTLTINGLVSSERNYDFAYATITSSMDAPEYNNTTNRFIYTSGANDINNEYKLQGGEIYYLHLGYRKDGGGNTGKDAFIINSIKLDGSETPGLYKSYPVVGDTVEITMVDNTTVSSAVTISDIQNIKLNLDWYTVQSSGNTYIFNNDGKLEIVDTSSAQTGTIDNSAYRAIRNKKELTLTSGTISIGAGTSSNYQRGIDNTQTGTFTMNGGTIKSDKNYTRMIYNENGELSGYTMNYYNTITKNVLFMPKEYFLDNFNALYNSFKTLSDNRIIANDIWLKNCLIGSNITMIDFDRYIKSSLSIEEIREINIARLMELFKKIYLYYVSSVMGKVPAHIWSMTDDIFSYSNNPVKRLSKVFEGYKKPIDLITKK